MEKQEEEKKSKETGGRPTRSRGYDPNVGVRKGEASHPGPGSAMEVDPVRTPVPEDGELEEEGS